jgi:hypothetical protein
VSVESLSEHLIEWAFCAETDDFDLGSVDRESPDAVKAFQQALSSPADIAVVEHIEGLMKQLWPDVLCPGGKFDERNAFACSKFFSEVGFLFKYKPYGVKIASPFGYSLFDLKNGQGFSFQMHVEPKLEAFHFLLPKNHSLVYISSREEWLHEGESWARAALVDKALVPHPPFVRQPKSGDVIQVLTTEVVHAVLGCVLEEYASCSVDAVERLLDQNARSSFSLPTEHTDVASLLRRCRMGMPAHRIDRTASGWRSSAWSRHEAAIEVGDDLWGSRVMLSTERGCYLGASDELLKVVVAVDADVQATIGSQCRRVPHGSFLCVPPGLELSLLPLDRDCAVAVHGVSRRLIRSDWTP